MLTGIHHLGLTVRDAEASARWYADVLGFRRVGEFVPPTAAWRKVFLRHDELSTRLSLAEHRDGGSDPFDETRVGLDHLAFGVTDRAELEHLGGSTGGRWGRPLTDRTVEHDPWRRGARVPRPRPHPAGALLRPLRVTKGPLTPTASRG